MRQLRKHARRCYRIQPVDHQGNRAGSEKGVSSQGVFLTAKVIQPYPEDDNQREVQVEICQVQRLRPKPAVLHPGVEVVLPEEAECALGLDNVQSMAISGLRPVDHGSAHAEI